MADEKKTDAPKDETPKKEPVYIRYTGNGAFFVGIPAKNFTKSEFEALEPHQQNEVLTGTIYKIPADAKSAEGGDK
jgi:hypothetical protein